MTRWVLIWIWVLSAGMGFAQEAEVDSARVDTAYVLPDSLAVLLVEIPLDSTLAHMGDSLFVPGPGRAHILRDEYGVPHIYGETDADVAFGFGYAQAQDHLLPMLLAYRGAAGRLSEVLGEQALESDTWVMLWRVHSVA
ncbi:MAG: penicillin acylase family protein, partial [bacterium]|nr:penicillin acylase family protein [bacterium]